MAKKGNKGNKGLDGGVGVLVFYYTTTTHVGRRRYYKGVVRCSIFARVIDGGGVVVEGRIIHKFKKLVFFAN